MMISASPYFFYDLNSFGDRGTRRIYRQPCMSKMNLCTGKGFRRTKISNYSKLFWYQVSVNGSPE